MNLEKGKQYRTKRDVESYSSFRGNEIVVYIGEGLPWFEGDTDVHQFKRINEMADDYVQFLNPRDLEEI